MVSSWFCHVIIPESENKRKQKAWKLRRPCQRTEKDVKHEDNGDTNRSCSSWNSPKRSGKKPWGTRYKTKNCKLPDHSTTKIACDIERALEIIKDCCYSDFSVRLPVRTCIK